MATTLPDATEHAVAEEEGGVGIITQKKAEKGVAIVTRNNQCMYYNTLGRVMVNFRPSFWRESRNN